MGICMVFHENVVAHSAQGPHGKAPRIERLAAKETSSGEISDEGLFRSVFECAGAGIAMVDPNGTLVASNPALHTMMGYTEGELVGMHFSRVTAPEDASRDKAFFAALTHGERTSN